MSDNVPTVRVTGWSASGLPVVGSIEDHMLALTFESSGKRVPPIPVGPGSAKLVPERHARPGFGPLYRAKGSRDFWLKVTPELEAYVEIVKLQELLPLAKDGPRALAKILESLPDDAASSTRRRRAVNLKDKTDKKAEREVANIEARLRQLVRDMTRASS